VAVIDSGVTTFHPDFSTGSSSRIIASTKFGSSITTEDLYGHGTHVAGIIGGSGYASSGKYKGMAPGVNLLNVKVTDDYGMTYESDVVNAMQWVYNNKSAYNIRVVNISLNSTVAQSYHVSPLDAAAEILWFNGIVVVVSAGNNGTANGPSTIYPPANDPFVITVGATEDKGTASLGDDTLAVFSAYGVTEDGFVKPDLVAPGRNVVAPLGGLLNIIYQLHPLHRVNNYYFRMSGTSMSAPVVSGAVALLLQDEPKLTPDQVKYRLMATSNIGWQGYVFADPDPSYPGYLDAYAAVNGTTTESANTGITVSKMLATGSDPVTWGSVGWNSVGWNSVGWNSVGWNSVGWNSVGWNASLWND
jgi:serine protease AprX